MATPRRNLGAAAEQVTHCKRCQLTFATWREFNVHQKLSDRHLSCPSCSTEYKTIEGAARHWKQAHAAEQRLCCPGCDKTFTRVGGLMGHLELTECPSIRREYLANRENVNAGRGSGMFNTIRGIFAWDAEGKDHAVPFSTPVNENLSASATTAPVAPAAPPLGHGSAAPPPPTKIAQLSQAQLRKDLQAPFLGEYTDIYEDVEEDLISFQLNATWDEPVVSPKSKFTANPKDFPALGARAAPSVPNIMDEPVPERKATTASSFKNHNLPTASTTNGNGASAAKGVPDPSVTVPRPRVVLPMNGGGSLTKTSHDAKVNTGPSPRCAWDSPPKASTPAVPSAAQSKPVQSAEGLEQGWDWDSPPKVSAPAVPQPVQSARSVTSDWDSPPKASAPAVPQPVQSAQSVTPEWDSPPKASAPAGPQPIQSAWGVKKNLFPDAPPAVAPPAGLLKSLSLGKTDPNSSEFAEHDPDSPRFKAYKYWVEFTKKYKCPHKGCTKSLASVSAFIQHLKSPAHMQDNQRLKCLKCLRFYASATALTQHVESQGVRCNIREYDAFGAELVDITAKTAVVAGVHDDETLKYAVHPDFGTGKGLSEAAQRVIQSNAAALKATEEQKEHYWTKNTHKW